MMCDFLEQIPCHLEYHNNDYDILGGKEYHNNDCYFESCFLQIKTNYDTLFIKEQAATKIQRCWKFYKFKKKGIRVFNSKTIVIDYHYNNLNKFEILKLGNVNIIINFIKSKRKPYIVTKTKGLRKPYKMIKTKGLRKPYTMTKPRGLRKSYKCGICGFFPKKEHICKGFL